MDEEDWPWDWDEPGYRFTEQDLALRLPQVVTRVNAAKPHAVKLVDIEGKGLGLMATRLIPKDVQVVQYGGRVVEDADAKGAYVVAPPSGAGGFPIDAAWGFAPEEKARWVNDPADVRYQNETSKQARMRWRRAANLTEWVHEDGSIWFHAKRDIQPGEELLWYYGSHYARPWVQRVARDAPAKRGRIASCVTCGIAASQEQKLFMCGDCGNRDRVWCSQRCGQADEAHKCL